MCIGDNEPGGPARCSGEALTACQRSQQQAANAAPAAHTRYERRHADLMGLFHTAAIQQDSPESAWSAVAAVTEYEQWFRPARSELSRARRQLDGDSPRFTARAVTLAREMVGV